MRLGAVLGEPETRNPRRRCGRVSTRREALAWGDRDDPHEPAIQEALDGKVVDWLEKVSDQEYLAELAE